MKPFNKILQLFARQRAVEKRRLGKTGLDVSVLGFGTAGIGFGGASFDRVELLLNSALDAGLNVIDTGECYMESEEYIGRAIAHRRKDFYIFSKCGHLRGLEEEPDWDNMQRLQESLDRSLRRLRTDHLDVFFLHSCPKEVLEKDEVIDFMEVAKKSGKTKFIGYSGENDAAMYAVKCGSFDVLEMSVNIADQQSIDVILPEAVKQQIGIVAKRPIANIAWRYKDCPGEYFVPYWERLKKLNYDFLEDTHGKAVEVALRFTISVPGVSTAIVGTQQPKHCEENKKIVSRGLLDPILYGAIRKRWKEVCGSDWTGQI